MRVARVRRWSNGGSAELVGVAPAITRCGEVGGISRWGSIAERGVRTAAVDVGHPSREHGARMVEAEEQGLVQEFVAQAALEALADAVLHRLAGCDEVPGDPVLARPCEHRVRGELGAVVGDDELGLATPGDQVCQFARDPPARDRRVGNRRQALLGDIVGQLTRCARIKKGTDRILPYPRDGSAGYR